MDTITQEQENQLLQLYAHVSKEAARMEMYALRAQKDNRADLAQLHTALAISHKAQAHRFLLQVRGTVGDSATNNTQTLSEELPALKTLYQRMAAEADKTNNTALITSSDHSLKINRLLTQMVQKHEQKQPPTTYHVCEFCGFIATEKEPPCCPVCTAASRRFIKVEQ